MTSLVIVSSIYQMFFFSLSYPNFLMTSNAFFSFFDGRRIVMESSIWFHSLVSIKFLVLTELSISKHMILQQIRIRYLSHFWVIFHTATTLRNCCHTFCRFLYRSIYSSSFNCTFINNISLSQQHPFSSAPRSAPFGVGFMVWFK